MEWSRNTYSTTPRQLTLLHIVSLRTFPGSDHNHSFGVILDKLDSTADFMLIVYIFFSSPPPLPLPSGRFLILAIRNRSLLLFCCLVPLACTCIKFRRLVPFIHEDCGQSFLLFSLQVSAPCIGGGPTIPKCFPSWHHGLQHFNRFRLQVLHGA